MDAAGPPSAASGSGSNSKTSLLGMPVPIAMAAAAALVVLLVLSAVVAAVLLARRRGARPPSLSRVEHAPSSASASASGSSRAASSARREKVGADQVAGAGATSSSGVASSSAAASSLESPVKRKAEAVRAAAGVDMEMEMGWGRWYDLTELDVATGGFCPENVVGEGGYGTVYRGILAGGEVVAVKDLFDHKGQAEKEFKVEVEAIGKVRHKHLVGLIGYCAEGPKRMLLYEFVENGNLEQWLHGDVGPVSPLTWEIRMKIAVGTAKGIAYLHEGLEPKVVHRDIKSSNILLDKKWSPRVSDFGMAKVLGSGSSYVTTRVMGTFGYVAPEYASTGMLNESSDIYSFGVLLMELISGRSPVDYNRPAGEVNLVEWFRGMVGSRRVEDLVDPRIAAPPPPRVLNRVLLVCLRCIDADAHKRPKMGQIVHMLEGDEFPFRTEHRSPRASHRTSMATRPSLLSENVGATDDSDKSMWR
ncbi:probable receptor-like serine/threonine-protein kinase At4g34500 [Zea mays]|uniref:non-specific serine/threonine protein kinase n=1 Tax=Zea mays TaxID=4577 RepID=K7VG11_MAIZE|nr:probable receptor-like serine/threonine-protein kinase At4g34500 [Zea mays]AQL08275.1 putative receptor-like serine/threonine-protein kinase [Zea mays]|eukprot:XP_008660365.1 probable receptor-like serine/threonine-protein kinase At4g34500 [Zea mays]